MRKQIILAAVLAAAAVVVTGCAPARQSGGYVKGGVSRETAQIDQLECTKSGLQAKRRVLARGGFPSEANAAYAMEYHACARRSGYRRRT
jgi:hypothetical protein